MEIECLESSCLGKPEPFVVKMSKKMLELRAKKKTNNRPGERPHSDSKSEPNVGDENAQCRCLTFGSEDSAQLQTRSHVEQVEGLDDSTRVAQKTSVTPATACERLSVRRSFRRSFFSPPIRFDLVASVSGRSDLLLTLNAPRGP